MNVEDLHRFLRDDRGQSTTEFILLVSLISVPLFILIDRFMRVFLEKYISGIVNKFTSG